MKAVFIDTEGIEHKTGGSNKHKQVTYFPRKVALLYVDLESEEILDSKEYDINLFDKLLDFKNNTSDDDYSNFWYKWENFIAPLTGIKSICPPNNNFPAYEEVLNEIQQDIDDFFDVDEPKRIFAKDSKLELKFLNNVGIYPNSICWSKDYDTEKTKYEILDLNKFYIKKYPRGQEHNPIKELKFFFNEFVNNIWYMD